MDVNFTASEARAKAETISPFLKQRQSPYRIIASHPELRICDKPLYNYIENGIFQQVSDISIIALRRQFSRKFSKKEFHTFKKRDDRSYLQSRLYKDYRANLSNYPEIFVIQMDTVYNNGSDGPFIQTFQFIRRTFSLPSSNRKKPLFP